MTEFEEYSLTGCLIDPNYDEAPRLRTLGGDDPTAISGARAASSSLPPRVDLRKYCSPVEDQGRTNSCVANAVVGALELLQRKQGHSTQDLSRLFNYYNARLFHNKQPEDQGTYVHFAMASLMAQGICEARLWPFSKTTINDTPTQACYQNAQHYRGIEFAEIQKGTPLTHVLAQEIPVVIAVKLPREAYLSAHQTDVMSLPEGGGTAHQHGNHAMVVVGYDLEQKTYLVRNSWGSRFARDGYFHMPMAIFDHASLSGQQWAIGSLNGAPGLELLGHSVKQSVEGMVSAAVSPQIKDMSQFASGIAKDMGTRLESAKKGFRDRLRSN
ncbi:MAG: C1 family peptidase [Pseudomonadota bacterium]